ncbi:hypothetical protein B0H19DRAFT_1242442 [Mycena capillaripes]|nr:hypothetical protein B0H19DRAFT_1242442 [Mycena capillaripes]
MWTSRLLRSTSRKDSLSAAPAQLPFRRLEGGSPIAAAQDIHEHPIVLGVGDSHARSMLLGAAEAVAQRANSAPPLNAFANPIALNGGARDHGRRRRHLLLDHRKQEHRRTRISAGRALNLMDAPDRIVALYFPFMLLACAWDAPRVAEGAGGSCPPDECGLRT